MEFTWKSFTFCIDGERICLKKLENVSINKASLPFVELQIAGRDHAGNVAAKPVRCSETAGLRYVSHRLNDNALTITQANEICEVTTEFCAFADTSAVCISSSVKNIGALPITV